MPKRKGHVPSYRLHKPSGQARVIINREHIYLGPYGSPESREKYARLIAEMSISAETATESTTPQSSIQIDITVEILLAYWPFAELVRRANAGDDEALAELRDILDNCEQIWQQVRHWSAAARPSSSSFSTGRVWCWSSKAWRTELSCAIRPLVPQLRAFQTLPPAGTGRRL